MSSHSTQSRKSGSLRQSKGKRSFRMKDVILDPGDDDTYDDYDIDSYEDCRIEIRNSGHNLTSVLMNPRETYMEDLLNEFAVEQSAPLDSSTNSATTTTSSLTMSSFSSSHSHSNGSFHSNNSSTHSNSSSASHYSTSSVFIPAFTLFTTKAEDEQLSFVMNRIKEAYEEYLHVHQSYIAAMNQRDPYNASNGSGPGMKLSSSNPMSHDELLLCFREVPEVFFRPEFTLQNIDMFNLSMGTKFSVTPSQHSVSKSYHASKKNTENGSDSIADSNDSALIQIPRNQQENLSKYLDIIELALLNNIWIRSPSFFRVLDDIRVLQTLVSSGYSYVTSLRKKYQVMSERTAMTVMRIPKLYTRQKNESVLFDKLASMQRVMVGRATIASMVELEDYTSALEVVKEMLKLYHSELEGINSMKGIGQQLDKYDAFICEVMCNKFVSLAIQFEDNASSSKGNTADDDLGFEPNSTTDQSKSNSLDYFDQLLHSLLSIDKLRTAINIYKSRLSDSIRLIVRTCTLEYVTSFDPTLVVDAFDGDNSADSTPFAARVREMSNENYLSCLSMCYENVLIAIQKAENVHNFISAGITKQYKHTIENAANKTIDDLTNSASVENQISTSEPNEIEGIIALSKSCLATACDLSQKSIVQLLKLRKESNGRMSVDKMKFLWEVSVHFVTSIEKTMGGSSAYEMRQSLLSQTKYFLDSTHEGHKGRLINILDNEKWAKCDVSPERQMEIDRLVSGKAFLQPKSSKGATPSTPSSIQSDGSKKDPRSARIENDKYNVVWSALFLVEIILTYLDVCLCFPLATQDLISRIAELLRLFDHRARQLVLGAQAMQSAARLESISARHLAVTAQSVDFISTLLPHIRAALMAQLPPKNHILLQEFDRISSELQDHHSAIVSKFVSIISDFMDASATTLRQVDWDRFQGQCKYFEDVIKNVNALHRVLLTLLPPELLQEIFQRIFLLLNRKIPSHFEEIMPSTQTGKQRIVDDITHLVNKFSELKQIDCKQTTGMLEETFRRKYLPSEARVTK